MKSIYLEPFAFWILKYAVGRVMSFNFSLLLSNLLCFSIKPTFLPIFSLNCGTRSSFGFRLYFFDFQVKVYDWYVCQNCWSYISISYEIYNNYLVFTKYLTHWYSSLSCFTRSNDLTYIAHVWMILGLLSNIVINGFETVLATQYSSRTLWN